MRARGLGHALAAVVLLALAACATRPPGANRPELTGPARVQAEAEQQAREALLARQPQWSLSGRIAVSVGSRGGSARIDWNQDGAGYEAALSAPVTRQSWRLLGGAGHEPARLEGLEGGPREGDDAARLLEAATGWRIPVDQLPDWMRGVVGPLSGAASRVAFGVDGHMVALEQLGWRVEYQEWLPAESGRPALPRRIVARNGEATVRLVIDRWDLQVP